jgi:hypothetical protein
MKVTETQSSNNSNFGPIIISKQTKTLLETLYRKNSTSKDKDKIQERHSTPLDSITLMNKLTTGLSNTNNNHTRNTHFITSLSKDKDFFMTAATARSNLSLNKDINNLSVNRFNESEIKEEDEIVNLKMLQNLKFKIKIIHVFFSSQPDKTKLKIELLIPAKAIPMNKKNFLEKNFKEKIFFSSIFNLTKKIKFLLKNCEKSENLLKNNEKSEKSEILVKNSEKYQKSENLLKNCEKYKFSYFKENFETLKFEKDFFNYTKEIIYCQIKDDLEEENLAENNFKNRDYNNILSLEENNSYTYNNSNKFTSLKDTNLLNTINSLKSQILNNFNKNTNFDKNYDKNLDKNVPLPLPEISQNLNKNYNLNLNSPKSKPNKITSVFSKNRPNNKSKSKRENTSNNFHTSTALNSSFTKNKLNNIDMYKNINKYSEKFTQVSHTSNRSPITTIISGNVETIMSQTLRSNNNKNNMYIQIQENQSIRSETLREANMPMYISNTQSNNFTRSTKENITASKPYNNPYQNELIRSTYNEKDNRLLPTKRILNNIPERFSNNYPKFKSDNKSNSSTANRANMNYPSSPMNIAYNTKYNPRNNNKENLSTSPSKSKYNSKLKLVSQVTFDSKTNHKLNLNSNTPNHTLRNTFTQTSSSFNLNLVPLNNRDNNEEYFSNDIRDSNLKEIKEELTKLKKIETLKRIMYKKLNINEKETGKGNVNNYEINFKEDKLNSIKFQDQEEEEEENKFKISNNIHNELRLNSPNSPYSPSSPISPNTQTSFKSSNFNISPIKDPSNSVKKGSPVVNSPSARDNFSLALSKPKSDEFYNFYTNVKNSINKILKTEFLQFYFNQEKFQYGDEIINNLLIGRERDGIKNSKNFENLENLEIFSLPEFKPKISKYLKQFLILSFLNLTLEMKINSNFPLFDLNENFSKFSSNSNNELIEYLNSLKLELNFLENFEMENFNNLFLPKIRSNDILPLIDSFFFYFLIIKKDISVRNNPILIFLITSFVLEGKNFMTFEGYLRFKLILKEWKDITKDQNDFFFKIIFNFVKKICKILFTTNVAGSDSNLLMLKQQICYFVTNENLNKILKFEEEGFLKYIKEESQCPGEGEGGKNEINFSLQKDVENLYVTFKNYFK